jgi:SAM-dependent methyltransferase
VHPRWGRLLRVLPVPVALTIAWFVGFAEPFTLTWLLAIMVIGAFATLSIGRPFAFAFQVGMLMLSVGLLREIDQSARPLIRERSFFGVTTIEDTPRERRLVHGTTLHGVQSKIPGRETEPLSYYAPPSGIGRALTAAPALYPNARIGYVGLGTGTLSCYARPGQRWTAYEIDESVVEIARDPRRFSYVSRCKPDLAVVLGDARAQLAATPPASFDVLAIDAFSSDAIPLHLLTREALATYARALAPEGVLLIHVSNRYLRLAPIVGNIGAAMGWRARDLSYSPAVAARVRGYTGSQWIALARTDATLDRLAAAGGGEWRPLGADPSEPTWTDDFASILPVLKPIRIPGVNA